MDKPLAYDNMLETCHYLADDLDGKLLDDQQQAFQENQARRIKYFIAWSAHRACSYRVIMDSINSPPDRQSRVNTKTGCIACNTCLQKQQSIASAFRS